MKWTAEELAAVGLESQSSQKKVKLLEVWDEVGMVVWDHGGVDLVWKGNWVLIFSQAESGIGFGQCLSATSFKYEADWRKLPLSEWLILVGLLGIAKELGLDGPKEI